MKANQCKYCKTTAQEIMSLTASLAERDVEVNKLCELVALHTCYTEQLEQENAALREEVERLKYQPVGYYDTTQIVVETRKQAARECLEIFGEYYDEFSYADSIERIKAKFGLEG